MKNQITFKHHFAGVATAAVVAMTAFAIGKFVPSDVPIVSQATPADVTFYKAFAGNDYVGLARVGIAKAMNADQVVKLGYDFRAVCRTMDDPDKLQLYVQPAAWVGGAAHVWGEVVAAQPEVRLVEFCAVENQADPYVMSASPALRSWLDSEGEKPVFVAVAK